MYNWYRNYRHDYFSPYNYSWARGRYTPYYPSSWWNWRNEVESGESEDEIEEEAPRPESETPAPPPEPEKEATAITSLDLDFMKFENRDDHHTEMYGGFMSILRRGQEFSVRVKVNSFDEGKDRINIQFHKGERPQRSKGTLLSIKIHADKETAEKDLSQDGWYGYYSEVGKEEIIVKIMTSSTAPVGKYKVRLTIYDEQKQKKHKTIFKQIEEPLYLIFNPWNKDDQVYMEGDKERKEYVESETGAIWTKRYNNFRFRSRPWNFGQYSRTSFKAAIHLLERSTLKANETGNATQVCRTLSGMANSFDNNHGVLAGNWSGDYSGGARPSSWNGSQKILEEYMNNVENSSLTSKEVKFGQCWVFSGLLTTLCRTLGIPARSVTNFSSAHDTDNSLTIDKHVDENGEPLGGYDDSVWNFHVWNEAWLKRPDISSEYDGWQAYDATPQEKSEGIYQCGPAPVKAIKEGNLYMNYDIKFIFSEVNGDRIKWLVKNNGDMIPSKPETGSVGKNISTRAVGSYGRNHEREDLTDEYKHPEGSTEEREIFKKAMHYSSRNALLENYYGDEATDVDYKCEFKNSPNGDISVSISAQNKADAVRSISVVLTAKASYYTGRTGKEVFKRKFKQRMQPKESAGEEWEFKAVDYLDEIDGDARLGISVYMSVKETKQWDLHSSESQVDKPDLDMEASNETPQVGEEVTVKVKMENPTDITLKECSLTYEGPGIEKHKSVDLEDIPPRGVMEHSLKVKAKYAGVRELIACFNCRELEDITGEVVLDIKK